jgi:hypothetical protein
VQIVAEYVRGRLTQLADGDSADIILEQLNDLSRIEDELDHLPSIARYAYEQTAGNIAEIMDPLLERYADGLAYVRSSIAGEQLENALGALTQCECQLAWLVGVIGAIVGGGGANSMGATITPSYVASILGGPIPTNTGEGEEIYDAELSRRVLTLMSSLDERLVEASGDNLPSVAVQDAYVRLCRVDPRLELAFVHFLANFRKAYINEQGGLPTQTLGTASTSASSQAGNQSFLLGPAADKPMTTAQVVEAAKAALAEPKSLQEMFETASGRTKTFLSMLIRLNLGDHTEVVTLMIQRLANNLRFWTERTDIIARSLDVLNELIYSYSSGRLLLTLDVITSLLLRHGEDYFPFLASPDNVRFRTQFYSALARLVFMEDENEVSGVIQCESCALHLADRGHGAEVRAIFGTHLPDTGQTVDCSNVENSCRTST